MHSPVGLPLLHGDQLTNFNCSPFTSRAEIYLTYAAVGEMMVVLGRGDSRLCWVRPHSHQTGQIPPEPERLEKGWGVGGGGGQIFAPFLFF